MRLTCYAPHLERWHTLGNAPNLEIAPYLDNTPHFGNAPHLKNASHLENVAHLKNEDHFENAAQFKNAPQLENAPHLEKCGKSEGTEKYPCQLMTLNTLKRRIKQSKTRNDLSLESNREM